MSQMSGETRGNPGNRELGDDWVTDEARLLAKISNQLADLQETAARFEHHAERLGAEFLPAVRGLVGRRTTQAAAKAGALFKGGRA